MILLGGSQVVRLGSVCVAPLGTSPLGARAIRARCLSGDLSGDLSGGALRGSSQGELSGGSWLLRACARGRAKCGDPGGRKGPVAAWGEAVYLPPEGCVTARGSYWNVWPGDLDLLRLMEPTGGPAYRSTAMVAVIKAKGVLLFASAVVAPSVAAGPVCIVFQGGGGLFCWVCVPRTYAYSFHAGQKKWTPPLGRCP